MGDVSPPFSDLVDAWIVTNRDISAICRQTPLCISGPDNGNQRPGQTAEFLTSEMRLQQPDGQTVDLGAVRVLFQCGVDYYASTSG